MPKPSRAGGFEDLRVFVSENQGEVGLDHKEESLKVWRLVKSGLRHADEGLWRFEERPMKAS